MAINFIHRQIDTGDVSLHIAECGSGEPVLFCHGFPDIWVGWKPQMEAVAERGYRAIALDMRGYGKSSAPDDPNAYTPFHTAGDLVALLDALELPTAHLVGHDFGASAAWYAAMMRSDRFTSVFCLSVPYLPLSRTSFLEELSAAGQTNFYMFDQMHSDAAGFWADAAVTIPGCFYWSSGSAPAETRWEPFGSNGPLYRPSLVSDPAWFDQNDIDEVVAAFASTGFEAPLNYYRSIQPFFDLARPFIGAKIEQPSFFMAGGSDTLHLMLSSTEDEMRVNLPGLVGTLTLDGVGHWPQREARSAVNEALIHFLEGLKS